MYRFIRYIFLFFSFFYCMFSAKAQLVFQQKEHDWGQMLWNEPVAVTISVGNRGAEAVTIGDIRTSNSAVKAVWPRTPILPGAFVEVRLEMETPILGRFDHSVTVYTEGKQEAQDVMHLKGNVVKEKKEGDDGVEAYPYHVGKIYLSTDNIEFDDVFRGNKPQQVISIYNAGSDIYSPELMHLPKYLIAEAFPKRVLPGRTGKIIVTLESDKLTNMGLTQTTVYVSRFPGDNVGKENDLSVSAVLIPSFDSTSVIQKELAPRLELSSKTIQLPPFGKKDKAKGKIRLTNMGKSTLEIKSIQIFNPALGVSLSKSKLAPGAVANLTLRVHRHLMDLSHSRLRVLMITNDPVCPKVILDVKTAE